MPYLRLVQSGTLTEVYEYANTPEYYPPKRRVRPRRIDRSGDPPNARRFDNLRRLKRSFSRIVRSNLVGVDSPAFCTLTMYQVLGLKRSHRFLRIFFLRLRKAFGGHLRYVAVVEFQKRGAVHFHTLIWGLPTEVIKNERFSRRIQHLWQRGFVDCLLTDGSERLAGYLAKYLSKSMQDNRLRGERAYSVSRNALRPVQRRFAEEFDDVGPYLVNVDISTPSIDHSFMTQWFGKGRYRLYN